MEKGRRYPLPTAPRRGMAICRNTYFFLAISFTGGRHVALRAEGAPAPPLRAGGVLAGTRIVL